MDEQTRSLISEINNCYNEDEIRPLPMIPFSDKEKNNIDIGYYKKLPDTQSNSINLNIKGDTGKTYILTKVGNNFTSCTCPSYINSKNPQSCKHIKNPQNYIK